MHVRDLFGFSGVMEIPYGGSFPVNLEPLTLTPWQNSPLSLALPQAP